MRSPVVRILSLAVALWCCSGCRAEAGARDLSPAASWLQSYLAVDTTNPPGNEARAVDRLEAIARSVGLTPLRLTSPGGRMSLVVRLPATVQRPDEGGVLLLHHSDVVAAGEGWSVPPFGGVVRDGSLWGRGAVDAKSLGVAHLAALAALSHSGLARRREVVWLAVADEENGGGEGTAWLWRDHPEVFRGLSLVLNEGGQNRRVLGRSIWWGIEVEQKRPLWLEVVARGRPGHAASLNPHSAVHVLVSGLARFVDEKPRWKVTGAARRLFAALAPFDPKMRALFSDLDSWVGPDGPRQPGMQPGMPAYFLDTVQVTELEGSTRINVVPAEARARVDVRLLPETKTADFLAQVRATLGPELEVSVLLEAPEVAASPIDTADWRLLVESLRAEAPVLPTFISGITDSRYFRERGIPAYGFSPFQLEGAPLRGVHGPDERIPLDELDRGVERMRQLLFRIVATSP